MKRLTFAVAMLALTSVRAAHADNLSPDAAPVFNLDDHYVGGLSQVTSFALLPDGRMVITQKSGEVIVRAVDGTTKTAGTFSVDTESEKGLLDVLAHPDFTNNGTLIFYYSLPDPADGGNRDLDRHRVSTVKLRADSTLDMSTLHEIVKGLRGPANHDGGALAIGPDGKLYVGVGDTGCNSDRAPVPVYDPRNYFATCLTNANGKILRVNLDGSIPADNPLVGKNVTACGSSCGDVPAGTGPARGEIWAWGFRNPWRFWFDPMTGNLWVGDVGEIAYEEIDVVPQSNRGKHYGWPWREAFAGHPRSICESATPGAGDCIEPAYACKHPDIDDSAVTDVCKSITGGLIVDGCEWPSALRGRYVFADNAADGPRKIWSLAVTSDRSGVVAGSRSELVSTSASAVHFGLGAHGDLYYATYGDHIGRITPKVASSCSDAGELDGAGGASDAAATAGSGGSPGAGGNTGAAGTRVVPAPSTSSDSSCGCRVPVSSRSRAAAALALLAALIGTWRARRAKS